MEDSDRAICEALRGIERELREIKELMISAAASKKPRASTGGRRSLQPLPEDFAPSIETFAVAKRMGVAQETVIQRCVDMRLWARANDVRKADWQATLLTFLRRDRRSDASAPDGRL